MVFWSDHGYHFGEKHHLTKDTLWERSSHVPLAIVAPGIATPGGRCNRPVGLLNLYPTLIDLCGLPARDDLEGVSLRPLLEDPQSQWDRPAVMTFRRNNHAVRSERYRYIRYASGGEELYDHFDDPEEWNNLAGTPGSTAVIEQHARWLPKVSAPQLPLKRAFIFDPESYTWRRRAEDETQ